LFCMVGDGDRTHEKRIKRRRSKINIFINHLQCSQMCFLVLFNPNSACF
jgi:hypothetical protein